MLTEEWKCVIITLGEEFVLMTLISTVLRSPADNLDTPQLVRFLLLMTLRNFSEQQPRRVPHCRHHRGSSGPRGQIQKIAKGGLWGVANLG